MSDRAWGCLVLLLLVASIWVTVVTVTLPLNRAKEGWEPGFPTCNPYTRPTLPPGVECN